jgi:NitT/TauT family transport system substrate-binding protein
MTKASPVIGRRTLLGATASGALAAAVARPSIARASEPIKIRIGYQFGLVYAPLLLMRATNSIKRYKADATLEFERVASGAVVRDQLIAKRLDMGVLGPPPFQIGWQHLNWKYLVGTGIFPYQLVTWREDLRSLKDFKPEDKIALPGPGSLQHILLSMAAKKQLGDARALDKNIIALPHPDATIAILAKNPSVAAHFANIPFIFRELETPGVHAILDGFDAFGGRFVSPLVFAPPDYVEANPLATALFIAAYNDAVAMLNLDPTESAKILAPEFKQSPETMKRWLTWPGMSFTSLPYGIMGWHEFMMEAGYVKKAQSTLPDVCTSQLLAWIGLQSGDGKNPAQLLQERA